MRFVTFVPVLVLLGVALLVAPPTGRAAEAPALPPGALRAALGVPAERLARLTAGINMNTWFLTAARHGAGPQVAVSAADLQQLYEIGFRHVRLGIGVDLLFDPTRPDALDPTMLAALDMALDALRAAQLAVVLIPGEDDTWRVRLASDDAALAEMTRFWAALAAHLAPRDPDWLFLEILNEPAFGVLAPNCVNPVTRWAYVQSQIAAAIRAAAPQHTILATSYNWSDVYSLQNLVPLADPNVVYTFHFYEPMMFTDQGTGWISPLWEMLHDLPYPSNAAVCAAVLPTIAPEAQHLAGWYCSQTWDAAHLAALIRFATVWAARHGVPLYAGEFGVNRPPTAPADRAAWVHDTRAALEAAGIGWAFFNYDSSFGLMLDDGQDHRAPDWAIVAALGLSGRPPTARPAGAAPPATAVPLKVPRRPVARTPPRPAGPPAPTPTRVCEMPFSDVPPTFWAYSYISWMYAHDVVHGYGDALTCLPPTSPGPPCFLPNAPVSRGQLVKMAVLAAGLPVINPPRGHFRDLAPGAPYYDMVETAYAHGIIGGYADGTVRAGQTLTRAHLAKILALGLGLLPATPPAGGPRFADVDSTYWAYPYVEAVAAQSIASGYGCEISPAEPCDGDQRPYFRPGNVVTRAQASKAVYLGWGNTTGK